VDGRKGGKGRCREEQQKKRKEGGEKSFSTFVVPGNISITVNNETETKNGSRLYSRLDRVYRGHEKFQGERQACWNILY
jgi:inner membrane protein involved in colicin E2 resistance